MQNVQSNNLKMIPPQLHHPTPAAPANYILGLKI